MTVLLVSLIFIHLVVGYPDCLLKKGECLDGNQGPLLEAVKPMINQNIAKETIFDVENVEECSRRCFEDDECGYFTYYKEKLPKNQRKSCNLVGFNLREACFNLEKACVLMKACERFNASCSTCQVKVMPSSTKSPCFAAVGFPTIS